MQRIGIGIIGAGGNMRLRHLPGLLAQAEVELVAVANRSVASAEAVAREFGIAHVAADWRDVIRRPDVDAIVIGTWPDMHAELTIAALEADKHVLCEARMAMNLAEARAMAAAAARHPELVAQLVPAPGSLAVDATISDLLARGELGPLVHLEIRAAQGFPDPTAPLYWRHQRRHSGLNVLALGIWYECLLRWVGPAAQVVAFAGIVVTERPDASGTPRRPDIPDHLDVLCHLKCGAQARLLMTAVCGALPDFEVLLHGTQATLRFSAAGLQIARRAAAPPDSPGAPTGALPFEPYPIPEALRGGWRVEEDFIRAIRGQGAVTLTPFATGVQYMEFTEAVALSLREQRAITLPLP
jgi:predicted dehydrogenase